MRSSRFVFLVILLTFAKSALAQQATASAPQGTALLQQSLTALSGARSITDVTLSGTARRIAGSDDESGTVVVKALAGTGTRIDLTLPSGSRSEIRNTSAVPVAGLWSGPDGVPHAISRHNLYVDPAWFPAFTLASLLSVPNAIMTYIGPETHDINAVQHVSVSQPAPFPTPPGGVSVEHLTQVDFFLDSTTVLPSAVTFNTHPDKNPNVDIAIEIQFSDYRMVSGVQVPFHVKKFINNSLAFDLQFGNAVFNSGLSATSFAVGAGL
jgi:hypothetical protein